MLEQNAIGENELLIKFQQGDERAFEALYRDYYARLYLHAYNQLRDRETAKDIIQDLFTALWTKRESLQIKEGISAYLYKSVRNRIIDYFAHQNIKSNYIKSLGQYLESSPETTDHLVRERQLAALIEAEIEKLPPQIKRIFELSRKENLSHKEIAEQLNISEQTVRWNVKSALKLLRMKFGLFLLIMLNGLL